MTELAKSVPFLWATLGLVCSSALHNANAQNQHKFIAMRAFKFTI